MHLPMHPIPHFSRSIYICVYGCRDREGERDIRRDRERGRERDWESSRLRSDRMLPRAPAPEDKPRARENGIINAVPSPPHRASTKCACWLFVLFSRVYYMCYTVSISLLFFGLLLSGPLQI